MSFVSLQDFFFIYRLFKSIVFPRIWRHSSYISVSDVLLILLWSKQHILYDFSSLKFLRLVSRPRSGVVFCYWQVEYCTCHLDLADPYCYWAIQHPWWFLNLLKTLSPKDVEVINCIWGFIYFFFHLSLFAPHIFIALLNCILVICSWG